ncbi:PKS-ER domain-containing protein [Mycena sanguinolenta]|uniref:PKS-ER domain-containing protein n=1 Tax=Mycena sanguinolenta TaxID=230812 RepID=A0A8H6XFK2_9AGAR|nr:PKS-ER domain-containing protein [Mycena sanguinolenta]
MAPVQNGRVLFNTIPDDYPVPGETTVYDTSQTIDIENVLLNGGILIKVLALSVDPYMRGSLRAPEIGSYMPAFTLGQPLNGYGVGVVLRSELPGVVAGAHVRGVLLHQEYMIVPNLAAATLEVIERDSRLDLSVYVSAAGMPGETAFMGWREYSDAKKGEVAFVSTGAGSVGSMVIQIAKQDGLKVIASAGSEEKVKFMKEIGADVAFNYKTTDVRAVLAKAGPIDMYVEQLELDFRSMFKLQLARFWDNVGGDTLDAAMEFANNHSRIIASGMWTDLRYFMIPHAKVEFSLDFTHVIGYNNGYAPMKNPGLIFAKSLHIHGFIVGNLRPKYRAAFSAEVVPKIASGEFKYTEDVTRGLDKVGDVILAVQKGTNTGKAIVRVADE